MPLESNNTGNAYNWDDFTTEKGLPVSQLRDIDLDTADIPEADRVYLQSLKDNKSFMAAGGILVKGTPWNPSQVDKNGKSDGIIRVFYTHEDYARMTGELLDTVKKSEKKFDAVVTMPRGGVAIGAALATGLGLELGYAHAQSYGHSEKAGDINIGEFILPRSLEQKLEAWKADKENNTQPRILLVDDMADSGVTFKAIQESLENMGYIVETAAIFTKTPSSISPDYCVYPGFPPMWIAQPGEAVFEGVTKGHNVGATAEHPITKKAYSIAYAICEQVRAIHKNPVRVITYVVQKDSPHATDGLLASVSRIVSSQIGSRVMTMFSTVRDSNRGRITIPEGGIITFDNTMDTHLPNTPDIQRMIVQI